jgi:hypothetical protein
MARSDPDVQFERDQRLCGHAFEHFVQNLFTTVPPSAVHDLYGAVQVG